MEVREYSFNTGAVVLNYAEVPAPGPPLVLLHGGNGRWQSFASILPDLAALWHIYAPDLRGHGKSGWDAGSYRLQDYADDTIAFLRDHIHEPAHLFGHSLGGIVALMVAAQYPEGVRAVAVGDSPLSSQTWHDVILQSQRSRGGVAGSVGWPATTGPARRDFEGWPDRSAGPAWACANAGSHGRGQPRVCLAGYQSVSERS